MFDVKRPGRRIATGCDRLCVTARPAPSPGAVLVRPPTSSAAGGSIPSSCGRIRGCAPAPGRPPPRPVGASGTPSRPSTALFGSRSKTVGTPARTSAPAGHRPLAVLAPDRVHRLGRLVPLRIVGGPEQRQLLPVPEVGRGHAHQPDPLAVELLPQQHQRGVVDRLREVRRHVERRLAGDRRERRVAQLERDRRRLEARRRGAATPRHRPCPAACARSPPGRPCRAPNVCSCPIDFAGSPVATGSGSTPRARCDERRTVLPEPPLEGIRGQRRQVPDRLHPEVAQRRGGLLARRPTGARSAAARGTPPPRPAAPRPARPACAGPTRSSPPASSRRRPTDDREPDLVVDRLLDRARDRLAVAEQRPRPGHVEERLVDGDRLDLGREPPEDRHDLAAGRPGTCGRPRAGTTPCGQSRHAVRSGIAECTPNVACLVARRATTPRWVGSPPPTITGFPRSSGRSRCSTAAKNASRSTWRMVRRAHAREFCAPRDTAVARTGVGAGGVERRVATLCRRRQPLEDDGTVAEGRAIEEPRAGGGRARPGLPARHVRRPPRCERAERRPELWGFLLMSRARGGRVPAHRRPRAAGPRLLQPPGRRVPPRPLLARRGTLLAQRADPGRRRPLVRRLPADAGDPRAARSSPSSGASSRPRPTARCTAGLAVGLVYLVLGRLGLALCGSATGWP